MSLKTLLPAPSLPVENRTKSKREEVKTLATTGPPPYGAREGWVSSVNADFCSSFTDHNIKFTLQ